ncbi:MAG: family N-acetyltransferase [Thermomicrobiales bacterium]|nr:family N-acetyltransferase [Thermomicrobiales bacterium]
MSSNDRDVSVVVLGPRDWWDLRAIRLEALRSEPAAYSSSYEETLAWSAEDWRRRLANDRSVLLFARAQNRLIGMVGGYLGSDEGDDSVAVVFGMYVAREHRGRGIGRLLLTSLIDRLAAFPQIITIRLGVTETQDPARRLYESVGFQVVGKTEEGIVVNERQYDELVMELRVR